MIIADCICLQLKAYGLMLCFRLSTLGIGLLPFGFQLAACSLQLAACSLQLKAYSFKPTDTSKRKTFNSNTIPSNFYV
jgi:hypothetical protein